ncbi:hypothetical protein Rsub_11038 [Raphidocelis subcapitata]|uniref:Enoyl reductase (ER) domain-containing protein n=1 Tax=Raphidocelis subcapitata TaxID=307507 RepID=A0A2V0PED4_9CHLO|nr:hypothetical protein Rsub_11038 [Raphidocelis subcapitata]|eukprot:GBF98218.1 hypothetical protein Rsub_11038 [Raphidocelis subcapitata]
MATPKDTEPLPAALDVTSIVLKRYVDDGPVPPDAFGVELSTLAADGLAEGEALCEVLYLSVDPYMRPLMRLNKAHYAPSFTPGKPLAGSGVALVRVSKAEGFAAGDVIVGRPLPWSSYAVLGADGLAAARKVPRELLGKVPLSYFVGTLGMPGLTAYSSLKRIAEPRRGETAFVSAAAGAVGQVAGQLLKRAYGCRVVGSAGSPEKVELLLRLGFDAAFNHKELPPAEALAKHCPDGVDVYFDNVGAETLEAVLDAANVGCRIVACGMISQYDLPAEKRYGVKNLFNVIGKQIKMQGFIVTTLAAGMEEDFLRDTAAMVADGRVKVVEDVTEGLENIGRAFADMMAGKNMGKAVVKVAAHDPFPAPAVAPRSRPPCAAPSPQPPHGTARRQRAAPPAAAPAAAAAAAASLSLPALLHAAGVFVLCCAGAAFLIAAIPALLAAARAAHRAEAVLRALEAEIPDTAASMRLSGLELSDCLSELGALGSDLTGGLRASARMVGAAESGLRAAPGAIAGAVVPAVARTEAKARGTVEGLLLERAASAPDLLPQVLRGTATAVKRARIGAAAAGFVAAAVGAGAAARGALDARAMQVARASVAAAGAAAVEGDGPERAVVAPRRRGGAGPGGGGGAEARPPAGDPMQRRQPPGGPQQQAAASAAAEQQRRQAKQATAEQQQRGQQQGPLRHDAPPPPQPPLSGPSLNGHVPKNGRGGGGAA